MPDPARSPVILGAARTPIGKFLGGLSPLSAPQLGGVAIRAAVARAGVPGEAVDDVIMGHVLQGGAGQAPARQAALLAGLPPSASALTVNKVCGSGLAAVMLAAQAIRAGEAHVVVAGGQESMSNAPHYLRGLRGGVKLGDQSLVDGMIHDGLWCATCGVHMGSHAEYTARQGAVTRERQDAFAAGSHAKAVAAQRAGTFAAELVPVEVGGRGRATVLDADEGPRADTTAETLAALRPAFPGDGDHPRSVTAGNASTLNDGAAALVVASEAFARAHGSPVLARIRAQATGAVAPRDLFFAPVAAMRTLMRRDGTAIGDYGLVEANEAFAAQALADGDALGWDWDRVNVHGGAIALGHPIGASGARVLVTLLHAMRARGVALGAATLCLGGGDAVALSIELA